MKNDAKVTNKKSDLAELQRYYEKLLHYKKLKVDQAASKTSSFHAVEIPRSELVRETGRLRRIIGEPRMEQFGRIYDPFERAFEANPQWLPQAIQNLDKIVNYVNELIGKLQSETTTAPSRYEFTSPIYWAERFGRWKPIVTFARWLKNLVGWVKTNRLIGGIIVSVIASIIATIILASLGII